MTDEKSPLDQAVDLLVYAPVGLALTARDALPDLIARGRERVNNQAAMARIIGQFAVQQGQQQAGRALHEAREQAAAVLEQIAGDPARTPVVPARPPEASPNGASNGSAPSKPPSSGPGAAALAIPEYDSLAASQVVPRLSGLGPDELEAVRAYEAAHRGRKTILSRIAQLQGGVS